MWYTTIQVKKVTPTRSLPTRSLKTVIQRHRVHHFFARMYCKRSLMTSQRIKNKHGHGLSDRHRDTQTHRHTRRRKIVREISLLPSSTLNFLFKDIFHAIQLYAVNRCEEFTKISKTSVGKLWSFLPLFVINFCNEEAIKTKEKEKQ